MPASVRGYPEDVTRADLDGFVLPLAAALVELGGDRGVPVKLRLSTPSGSGCRGASRVAPRCPGSSRR